MIYIIVTIIYICDNDIHHHDDDIHSWLRLKESCPPLPTDSCMERGVKAVMIDDTYSYSDGRQNYFVCDDDIHNYDHDIHICDGDIRSWLCFRVSCPLPTLAN